ncbi:PTPRH [Bugula neritina]|uniref:PTPRH n=1 Tax=Bugula neritina TaxID=10212 RepID=A0A7J7KEV6_BUGNE|nr:PTPRH [Bugula neritina]
MSIAVIFIYKFYKLTEVDEYCLNYLLNIIITDEKFQQVSIFLSNIGTVPTSPLNLPNNNDWTELPLQFNLKESGDDFVTYITSSQDGSLPEARHIAVYSTSSVGLVINEVEVYGYGECWVLLCDILIIKGTINGLFINSINLLFIIVVYFIIP